MIPDLRLTVSVFIACRLAYDPGFLDFIDSKFPRVRIAIACMCIALIEPWPPKLLRALQLQTRVTRHVTPHRLSNNAVM